MKQSLLPSLQLTNYDKFNQNVISENVNLVTCHFYATKNLT